MKEIRSRGMAESQEVTSCSANESHFYSFIQEPERKVGEGVLSSCSIQRALMLKERRGEDQRLSLWEKKMCVHMRLRAGHCRVRVWKEGLEI